MKTKDTTTVKSTSGDPLGDEKPLEIDPLLLSCFI